MTPDAAADLAEEAGVQLAPGQVLAWDDNELRGTLGLRAGLFAVMTLGTGVMALVGFRARRAARG